MKMVKSVVLAGLLAFAPVLGQGALAQDNAAAAAPAAAAADSAAAAANAAAPAATAAAPDAAKVAAPPRMKPTEGIGMPMPGEYTLQKQFTPLGRQARWLHDVMLLPIITVISIFVLILMLWVMFRYRRSANPVPSKTSHNTTIEVLWTVLPVVILLAIAVPSIGLLAD
ncbi:cytochrome c oxidase subunit II, partial [Sphingobium sp. SCG-1]